MAGGSKLKHLMTLTFTGEIQERKTITPAPSWAEYDFLLIVPDLIISSQDGQSSANRLWYSISEGTNNRKENYDGQGAVGVRDVFSTVVIAKGTYPSSQEYVWLASCWAGGRLAYIAAHDGATLADVTIVYGLFYGGTYGIATGTAEVYGGKF